MRYKSILRGLSGLGVGLGRIVGLLPLYGLGAGRVRGLMSRFGLVLTLAMAFWPQVAFGQATLTPNIGLQVPAFNQSNWQVPINYDLNRLDQLLSGGLSLPGLNPLTLLMTPQTYSALIASYPCTSGNNGRLAAITDSTTTIWGAVVSGGSSNYAWVYCNGSQWVVQPYAGGTINYMLNPMMAEGDMIYDQVGIPTRLPVGTLGQCIVSNGSDPVWGSCAGITSTAWSSLSSPISDVSIPMTGWLTTFVYNASTTGMIWQNSTAATSGGGKNSPSLLLKGTYWNGSTSQTDTWNWFVSEGGGTNGNSIFTMLHTGSSGLAAFQVPNFINTSTTLYGVLIGGGAGTAELSISPGSAGQILTSNGPSAAPSFQPPVSTSTAILNLSTAQLLEFNVSNTLAAAATAVGGNTVYTGTFPNCSTPNALIGEWDTISGFINSANNGTFGPVSACTSTMLTVPNSSGVAETHAGAALNIGFQIVGAQGAGTIVVPETAVLRYTYGGTAFTLGNTDNAFTFSTSPTTGWNSNFAVAGIMDQTANEQSIVFVGVSLSPGQNSVNTPIIIGLGGTTPALTLGNGSVQIKLDWIVR